MLLADLPPLKEIAEDSFLKFITSVQEKLAEKSIIALKTKLSSSLEFIHKFSTETLPKELFVASVVGESIVEEDVDAVCGFTPAVQTMFNTFPVLTG